MRARAPWGIAALLAAWCAFSGAVWAQAPIAAKPKGPVATPSPSIPPTPTVAPPPPYDAQLLRLAELMGALSYLRDICGDGDGAAFRDRFAKLMDVEAPTPERKEALAGAFNRGFSDYELTYRICTPSAKDTVAGYLEEVRKIAQFVATRYGG